MPTTNRVLSRLYVLVELLKVVVLNRNHSLPIQLLNALPNLPVVLSVEGEVEPRAPVAKIA